MLDRQRMKRRRRQRRSRSPAMILARCFLVFQTVIGGASGILIGAIIINAAVPGHPIYVGIRSWLRQILGM